MTSYNYFVHHVKLSCVHIKKVYLFVPRECVYVYDQSQKLSKIDNKHYKIKENV